MANIILGASAGGALLLALGSLALVVYLSGSYWRELKQSVRRGRRSRNGIERHQVERRSANRLGRGYDAPQRGPSQLQELGSIPVPESPK
jgi:hypothetical protein